MNWFGEHGSLVHVAVATATLFGCLVVLIRLFGARSIASLTPFDFVIVVAIGNLMATVAVDPKLPVLHAVVAIATLFVLQWLVDLLTSRSRHADALLTGKPKLLYYEGFQDDALKGLRLTRADILQAMRARGFSQEEQVLAVVLETNGTLTVVGRQAASGTEAGTLAGVEKPTRG